jgi:hypothetical protein
VAVSSLDTKSLIEAYLASVVEEGFPITLTQAERDFSVSWSKRVCHDKDKTAVSHVIIH